jgi:hypothetical protein
LRNLPKDTIGHVLTIDNSFLGSHPCVPDFLLPVDSRLANGRLHYRKVVSALTALRLVVLAHLAAALLARSTLGALLSFAVFLLRMLLALTALLLATLLAALTLLATLVLTTLALVRHNILANDSRR